MHITHLPLVNAFMIFSVCSNSQVNHCFNSKKVLEMYMRKSKLSRTIELALPSSPDLSQNNLFWPIGTSGSHVLALMHSSQHETNRTVLGLS